MADDTQKQLREELDTLKQDLASLRGDLQGMTEAIKGEGAERFEELKDRVRSGVDEQAARAERAYRRTAQRGERAVNEARECFEERPLMTLFGAFGLGLLIGKLMDRG
jgi:ElaB/YqjD/DUF883 family membrane-anchored ribosome-binding protein